MELFQGYCPIEKAFHDKEVGPVRLSGAVEQSVQRAGHELADKLGADKDSGDILAESLSDALSLAFADSESNSPEALFNFYQFMNGRCEYPHIISRALGNRACNIHKLS